MAIKVREFLRELAELVRLQVPPQLQGLHTVGPMGSLVKFHFGEPRIHYEVWVQRRHKIVELGLHFEGKSQANADYLERLTARFSQIRSALGNGVEAEQWTPSWTRIHQSLPLQTLEEDFLWEVSTRISRMIGVLEPMVREVSSTASVADI